MRKSYRVCRSIFPIALLWFLAANVVAEELQAGKGSFVFKLPQDGKEVNVWYYKPKTLESSSQIVFVMHGLKRNGEKYRDSWLNLARRYGFLLLVPEFSEKDFPGSAGYNLGNMYSPSGAAIDESSWSFTIIEELFDHIILVTESNAPNYNIYGHSAGAQFVHRLVMFKPDARIRVAISANAGWYTFPTDRYAYPYGLRGLKLDEIAATKSFGKNLTILLGARDIDENHKYLRKTSEAMEQGKHRLERGHSFYESAVRKSKELRAPLKWNLQVVAGVAHSNARMAPHAAKLIK